MRLLCLLILACTLVSVANAQDPPLAPEQQQLLAEIESAESTRTMWETYSTITTDTIFYGETLTISFGNTFTNQREIISTSTTEHHSPDLATLMTIENMEQNFFSPESQTLEDYTLLVEARRVGGRLYMQALRNGGSDALPPMPNLQWIDITDDPRQFSALAVAHLERLVLADSSAMPANPLLDIDFAGYLRDSIQPEWVAGVVVVSEEPINAGPLTGTPARQIRVQLNPLAILSTAFEGMPNRDALLNAFVNEAVDMSWTVWLDLETGEFLHEQLNILVQGELTPNDYVAGEAPEGSALLVIYQLEHAVDYVAVGQPVNIEIP
ncbi:MAG: hypothetical protein H6673_05240 [Anaerolineales bacterium]|nr:hypothetical protein [Anaerolineales bacterium]